MQDTPPFNVTHGPEHRALRQFVAVAEELHFSRAAVRLHMTQPPLTQAIQRLERELGAPLFVRTQRSVALSPAGRALLPVVQRLLLQLQALPQLARAAAAGSAGVLRLGFVSTITYGPLPRWLRSFRSANPDVALQLREATLDVQLLAFDNDEIDAGFVLHAPGAPPAGLQAWTATREAMVLALPEGHALAQQRSLSVKQLATEPLVMFPRPIAASLHDAVLGLYRAAGHTPRIAQEANQMQTIVSLVAAGMGVAWVPAALMQLQRPGVVYRPLAAPGLTCHTSLVWKDTAHPVVARFVAHVVASAAGPRKARPQSSKRREAG